MIGLILEDSRHYIDHLAPFCSLQGWPLVSCEGAIADLARHRYPNLEVIETNRFNLILPELLVSCDTRAWIESAFGASESRAFLWLPHGNSDKGWNGPFFDALNQETALVYGQKMIDFMRKKNQTKLDIIRIGNFRLSYWLKHRAFYDAMIEQELPQLNNRRTYLYAPTWDDAENNSSFWQMFPLLAMHLPDSCNLIVKLHPNTQHRYAPEIERLIGLYAAKKNIHFLLEWLPIYPLLNVCDAYIGDMSSIGYDFLYWNRPMFFLNAKRLEPQADPGLFLYRCGHPILPEDIGFVFREYKDDDARFGAIRKQVYEYTFDHSAQKLF